jgi:hypothetical protein
MRPGRAARTRRGSVRDPGRPGRRGGRRRRRRCARVSVPPRHRSAGAVRPADVLAAAPSAAGRGGLRPRTGRAPVRAVDGEPGAGARRGDRAGRCAVRRQLDPGCVRITTSAYLPISRPVSAMIRAIGAASTHGARCRTYGAAPGDTLDDLFGGLRVVPDRESDGATRRVSEFSQQIDVRQVVRDECHVPIGQLIDILFGQRRVILADRLPTSVQQNILLDAENALQESRGWEL